MPSVCMNVRVLVRCVRPRARAGWRGRGGGKSIIAPFVSWRFWGLEREGASGGSWMLVRD